MVIDTRAIGFRLTDAIQLHVEARVEAALGFAARHVVRVTARLDDVNGEGRSGPDKRCQLVVALRRGRTVAVEHVDADLYVAIDAAAQKARRSVLRELERDLALARKVSHRPGVLLRA